MNAAVQITAKKKVSAGTIKKPYKQQTRERSPNHGGARQGSGKKPMYADEGRMTPYSCMLTPSLREKITRNGGATWLRDLIAQATDDMENADAGVDAMLNEGLAPEGLIACVGDVVAAPVNTAV